MRPLRDRYFLDIAVQVSVMSTCLRRQVGAVLVRDKRIVATGYNGAPAGTPHCVTCLRDDLHIPSGERHEICRGAHGDGNAVAQAGRELCVGATLYIHGGTPCAYCAKLIINNGVARVICDSRYPDNFSLELLDQAGVVVDVIDENS